MCRPEYLEALFSHVERWGDVGVRRRDFAPAERLTREVYRWYGEGRLKLPPGRVYAFEAARQALAAPEGRNNVGKIRLQPDS